VQSSNAVSTKLRSRSTKISPNHQNYKPNKIQIEVAPVTRAPRETVVGFGLDCEGRVEGEGESESE
jgi:hypothetical protein